jgi:hypothetical protein
LKYDVDYDRLCDAIGRSRFVLKKFRTERFDAVKQYLGKHWSDEAATQNIVPVNLISMYCQIVGRSLIAKEPRVMLSTFEAPHKPVVAVMEKWINQQVEKINLANTLQRVVLDALFSVGICKVALATQADAAHFGFEITGGQPYAEAVDLDDFVFDTHARDFRHVSFIGHRYRCPLKAARAMGYKGGKKLEASQDQPFNAEGDEKISALQRMPYAANADEFEEMVDLWEIYLPRHKLVVTLADDYMTGPGSTDTDRKPLREQQWVGPATGPYHILGFGVVPGNAMPKAPIMDLIDLHCSVNNIFRKLLKQSERVKVVDLVAMGNTDDGERLKNANDGDIVPVGDPKNIVRLMTGGPAGELQAFGIAMRDLFSWLSGNLDMMGGLSPQSKTLGQDKLLAENASAGVSDKQDQTVRFVSSVVKSLCWFYHHHPRQTMKVQHEVQGLPEYNFTRKVGPQQRQQVPWDDLGVKVDPYSLRHQTPEARAQALVQMTTQVVMPMMQIAQQQGIALDLHALLGKLGRYMDMPDLAEILTIQEPPAQDPGSAPSTDGPGMPSQTKRTYERVNRSQQTGPSQSTSLQQALLGRNPGGQNGKPAMNGAA